MNRYDTSLAVLLRVLFAGAAAALPACELVATEESAPIGPVKPFGSIDGDPTSSTDFGDRLGPTFALSTDTASSIAAPLSALQAAGQLAGAPSSGPDVVVGGLAVYSSQTTGKLVAIDLASGAEKWSADVPLMPGWIASDAAVVCGPEQTANSVACVNLADGSIRFRTPIPNPASPYELSVLPGVLLHTGSNANLVAVDTTTGQILYQHGVVAYRAATFRVGAGLVVNLAANCPNGVSPCLASIEPRTGAVLGDLPQIGALLWRSAGTAVFAGRDAQYQRTIVALDEATHQFSDVSGSYATFLNEVAPLNQHELYGVAGPLADGAVYLNMPIFSSPGGKLCRFEVASQTKTWCFEAADQKIRVHPNALFVVSNHTAFEPATGVALTSQNGLGVFFGHWGFKATEFFEVK